MEGEGVIPKAIPVGSMMWKNATMKTVQESDNLVRKTNSVGKKSHTIPPANRAILTDLCNRNVNQYGRSLRQTTNAMREAMIDVNFQIRSLNRLDENLEKIKSEIDKNIKKNNMSCFIRSGRPTREMVRDNADLLLREEQQTLRDLRKSIETKQWRISGLGNKLADFRKILTMYLDRKSKVLDLVPDSTLPAKETRNDEDIGEDSLPEVREINNIMRDSLDLIEQAKIVRRDGEIFVNEIEDRRRQTTEKATKALQTKILETRHLQKELKSAIERNRQLANRSVRNFHETEHSWLELKGPESAKHLATNERADRPLVRSFHKRSVGNLPEITDQMKGSDVLLRCLRETSNNIGMLKMAEIKLHEDVADKNFGLKIDRQIAVLRSRKHFT